MLEHETRRAEVDSYALSLSESRNKRRLEDEDNEGEAEASSRARVEFVEEDGCMIEGLEVSLGSFVGSVARNARPAETQKEKYFYTIGMNGIFDVSDSTSGSQMNELAVTNDKLDKIKKTMHMPSTIICDEYELLLENVNVDRREKESKQRKEWYQKIKQSHVKEDKKYKYYDSYIHILKLHRFYHHLFEQPNNHSEMDFVIKFWSPLVENAFRCSGINPHWGDTVPNVVTASGLRLKMDLRLTDIADVNIPDYGCGEVAAELFQHKYYKDKLKTVLAAKSHLNQLLESSDIAAPNIPAIDYPFILISGYEIALYSMHMPYPGLYILEAVKQSWFPTINDEIRSHGIRDVLALIDCYVGLCLSVKSRNQDKRDVHKVNSRKSMNDLTKIKFKSEGSSTTSSAVAWIRPLWASSSV